MQKTLQSSGTSSALHRKDSPSKGVCNSGPGVCNSGPCVCNSGPCAAVLMDAYEGEVRDGASSLSLSSLASSIYYMYMYMYI